MRLLFDHGVPSPLRRFILRHDVTFARDMGWEELVNGALLTAAEAAGFEILVTCDKRMVHEQNLQGRLIGIAVLPTNLWPDLQPHVEAIATFIDGVGHGEYKQLDLPRPTLRRRPKPMPEG